MVEHLPELIDPLALAEKGRQFKGVLPLSQMTRLQDLLMDGLGEVSVSLKFGKDGKLAVVTGVVAAELELQCQCCLGAIPWKVDCRVNLGLVKSLAEADLLPESYEPLLLEGEGMMPLADIVQEELLLALPVIPQHDACELAAQAQTNEKKEPPRQLPERPNPFAVLAKLKQ
jgi:uncharacterized protein